MLSGPAGTTQATHPTTMAPPKPLAGQPPISVDTSATMPSPQQQKTMIAPQPGLDSSGSHFDEESQSLGKKQQKRAANRRSAQLSRKRKKQFIEELKEENDDLRRKEQILRSIPDLIVVFDSSGKVLFISESVSRFLKFKSTELEGSSFWDRLCVDSVRLLKAAFMDSLAARQADSDTAPLGSGVWELRLVDKDGSQKIVTLNGVVHFAGERPECVCSIRPREEAPSSSDEEAQDSGAAKAESSVPSNRSDTSSEYFSRINHIKPHQSVVSNFSLDGRAVEPRRKKIRRVGGERKEAMRISDSNSANSSMESESGSASSD